MAWTPVDCTPMNCGESLALMETVSHAVWLESWLAFDVTVSRVTCSSLDQGVRSGQQY